MSKKITLSSLELITLVFFICSGMPLLISFKPIFSISRLGSIVSVVIGIILGFINIYIIIKLRNKLNNKYFKLMFLLPLIIYIINRIAYFVKIAYLEHINPFIVALTLVFLILYSCKHGIKCIIRSSFIFFIIIVAIFIFNNFFLLDELNINNYKPILSYNFISIIKCSLLYYINTLPIFMLIFLPKNIIYNKDKYNKNIILGYILSSLFILITYIITLGVLGINIINNFEFPYYMVIRRITLFGFFERLENIISFMYLYIMIYYLLFTSYIFYKK